MSIRPINQNAPEELELVAQRMRLTLIDVLGNSRGTEMYSMDWLKERVLWHLDEARTAVVFLSENTEGEITGQAIVRIEQNEQETPFAFFSTIYVAPEFRRRGIAKSMIEKVEAWSLEKNAQYITYNTAENNSKITLLFESRGYEIVMSQNEMVKLRKDF